MRERRGYIEHYTKVIMDSYHVDEVKSRDLAEKAVISYESHGGHFSDLNGMTSVIQVVVRKWIAGEVPQ